MIKIDLEKIIERVIDKSVENGFKEISLEQDKNITFMKFVNSLLQTEEFILPNFKLDYNTIEKFTQNLVGIEHKDKENFVKTFLTPTNKTLCRVYIFRNQHGRMINIKILEHSVEDFKNYIAKIPNSSAEEKGVYYNEILKNKSSLIIISAQTENLKRNFAYSIIEEINKNKISKIISFEDPIEQLITNKKSFVHQMTYFKDAVNYVRFLTPDYVFIHENLDKDILLASLNMANSGIKVFIMTSNTDAEKNFQTIDKYLEGQILGLETFEHLHQYFITLSNDNHGNNFIWKITDQISLKR